jgi:alpha-mannosidase
MKFEQLVVVLPCHTLEDLSLNREPAEAEELLSAWSALFHPVALGVTGNMPQWVSAEYPPQDVAKKLFILPDCSESLLPPDWLPQVEAANAGIVRGKNRPQMIQAVLKHFDEEIPPVDPELVADFLALGVGYFLIELLTRQLRYMSNLDEVQFHQRTMAAAEGALKGDTDSARENLQGAFDLLTESREYFYPVEAHLLDLTLVASTTLGQSLRDELARSAPVNLLLSGQTLNEMAAREPATLALLREAIEKQTASLIGGERDEEELPLMPLEAILAQLRRGLACYETHLGCRPTIFGRRRFGLTPALPSVLGKLGFIGALHFTLDGGRFPTGNQSKIRWEGLDATAIEALVRLPLDVTQADAFLRLPETLGQAMDLDHAASVVFAHWPGQTSTWYEDLRRIAAYSPALGRLELAVDYFHSTEYAGQTTRYAPDKYRSPYLRQDVAAGRPDPISRWTRYYRRRSVAETIATLETLAQVIHSSPLEGREPVGQLFEMIEGARSGAVPDETNLDEQLAGRLDAAKRLLAERLAVPGGSPQNGYLVVNPWSFPQRQCVDVSALDSLPAKGGPVWLAGSSQNKKQAIVDVPAMGFAWLEANPEPSPAVPPRKKWGRSKKPEEAPLAEENVLRNDYFQVELNPVTGAIKSIRDFARRGNRLAQQIAYRSATASQRGLAADDEAHYTVMAADEITVLSPGPLVGQTVSRGRLLDRDGQLVARFVETLRLERGSRVLDIDLELEPVRLPEVDPWNSYYAARFAWGDATADLYRSVHLIGAASEAAQLESPHFLDLRDEKTRTTILTAGLPYHRRFGLCKLDTLLIVHGESARRFRFAIGIDLPYPVPSALGLLAPEVILHGVKPPPAPSGWLYHLNARNIVATAWEPVVSEGRVSGIRVRLLETEGRRTTAVLRTFRPVQSAHRLSPPPAEPITLPVSADQITIEVGGHEWVEVVVDGG